MLKPVQVRFRVRSPEGLRFSTAVLPVPSFFQGALRCRRGPCFISLHARRDASRLRPRSASSSRVSRDAARRRWSLAFVESFLPDSARDPRALEATTTTDVLETCGSSRTPARSRLAAARVAGFAPSHEQISAQERDAMVADPRGRAAAARLARGCFPSGSPRGSQPAPRGSAERRRVRCARLRHLRRRGGDPLAAPTRASGARAVPRAPAQRQRRRRRSDRRRRLVRVLGRVLLLRRPRVAPPTASLTTRDLHRVAAVLGVRPRDVPTALRDGSPYLPTRFVALLGRTRVCEFFATNKQRRRPAKKRKRAGRARTKNEEEVRRATSRRARI